MMGTEIIKMFRNILVMNLDLPAYTNSLQCDEKASCIFIFSSFLSFVHI